MNNEKRNKHMTLEDRIEIQECLNKGMTFKAIAQRIGKDQTTVSKEIKLHGKTYTNSFTKTDECCPRLLKAPFVCNGCSKRNHSNCPHVRRMYQAKTAQREYETVLTESREGIPLTKEEFYKTEAIISSAVKAGQNVYHAIQANNLSVSKTTVYRHIECGYYTISKIDLPRAVKFKSRKEQKGEYVPKGVKTGRSFEDFLLFLEENPSTNYVETLVVLSHKKPDSHLEVKIDFDNTSLDKMAISERAEKRKPQEKTTYKKIQKWIEENYGFKVHTAYVAEVKRELGLPMYDAPNAVEELKRPRSHPTEEMTIAIKAALKHFEII